MRDIFPATAARVAEWAADPGVLGVLLVGSQSRGHADAISDDDLEVLLSDAAFAALPPADCAALLFDDATPPQLIYDAEYTSLTDLRRKATSPHDLDRWPYERAGVLFDRDGTVAPAVAAAGRMDPAFRHLRLLHATLDTAIAARRAQKTLGREFPAAGRLLIARGAKALARILFALESRWVPLDHWLEPELRTLTDPTGAGPQLLTALGEARPEPLLTALAGLEDRLAAEDVPRPADRRALFYEVLHPTRAAERAVHGLY
ncbi:MAG TPA: hypothetical protein VM536_20245 [Chloroflexia bacterium]|nr:hypothetical protein [Chloroflexia bacterium]